MTLRDYCKPFLKSLLIWAKYNRDYWQSVKDLKHTEFTIEWSLTKFRYTRFLNNLLSRFKGD